MIRPEQIHLKERHGPVTDLTRKRGMSVIADLSAAVSKATYPGIPLKGPMSQKALVRAILARQKAGKKVKP